MKTWWTSVIHKGDYCSYYYDYKPSYEDRNEWLSIDWLKLDLKMKKEDEEMTILWGNQAVKIWKNSLIYSCMS